MKVVFDPTKDILQLSLKPTVIIQETSQIAPGLILDYDEDGNVIGLEFRKASEQIEDPQTITYSIGCANEDKPQMLQKD